MEINIDNLTNYFTKPDECREPELRNEYDVNIDGLCITCLSCDEIYSSLFSVRCCISRNMSLHCKYCTQSKMPCASSFSPAPSGWKMLLVAMQRDGSSKGLSPSTSFSGYFLVVCSLTHLLFLEAIAHAYVLSMQSSCMPT